MEEEECGDRTRSYFFFFSAALWAIFAVVWMVNTLGINQLHTKPLQRIMSFVLIFKFLHNLFVGSLVGSCPSSSAYPYWGLATTSTFTLYNTFIYTTLILISKGFCVTRELLERGEVTVVAMTMGAVYLGFSAYMIEQIQLSPLLIIMLLVLFYLCHRFSSSNIRALRIRYELLRTSNVRAMLPPIAEKIRMMKTFRVSIYIYFIEQLATIIILVFGAELVADPSGEYWLGVNIWGDAAEFIVLVVIYWTFRSQDHGQYFTMAEVVDDQPVVSYVPFYKASFTQLSGEESNTAPLLLIPPQRNNNSRNVNIRIGLPLQRSQPRQSYNLRDSLRIPLLAYQ